MKKLLLLLLIAISFSSCKKEPENTVYRYEVSGSANDYSITYANSGGNTEQKSSVTSGWYYYWTDTDFDRFLYISAQNNTGTGTVTVKILQDGKVIKEATSTGAYVIATASR